MKQKKRILSILLALMLIAALGVSPATAFAEEAETAAAAEVIASPEVLTETGAAAPVITGHPTDQTVTAGEKVSFTVNASGDSLTYQWQVNKTGTWNNCTSTGYNRSTFSFTAKESYSGWAYRCVVSNAGGRAVSEDAVLTVTEATPPDVYGGTSKVTCNPGSTVSFSVYANGTGLTYQWQVSKDGGTTWKNCTSTGYNTDKLSFTAKASYDGWQYRCRVSNSAGVDYSEAALLVVDDPETGPVITSDPDSLRISAGQRATFSVSATGTGLTYQWQVSKDGGYTWKNCTSAGCTSSTFSFVAKASYSGWQYRCVVSSTKKTVNSYAALLTVESGPVIYSASDDLEVSAGGTVDLWIYAESVDSYQWQYSKDGGSTWKNCTSAGATSVRFSFTATAAMNGRLYRCVVTNAAGSTASDPMTLTVTNKPVITSQPYAESVFAGQKATFSVEAENATGYRWQYSKDGGSTWTNCTSTGSTSATFSFKATAAMSERYYRCVVSNASGSVTSKAARLFVDTRPLITQQPTGASVTAGTEVTLQVKADRGESYRWQYSKDGGSTWTNCTSAGATSATFTFSATTGMNGRLYRCVVSNASGSATSNTATLRVLSHAITEQYVYQCMIAMKAEYPEGRHWTNADGYNWKGYSPENGVYWGTGYGCAGFAFLMSDAAFGDLPSRYIDVDFNKVRVGDILRVNNDSHSVIVLEKHSGYIVIAEGNYNSSIHWGRTMSASEVNNSTYIITRYPES